MDYLSAFNLHLCSRLFLYLSRSALRCLRRVQTEVEVTCEGAHIRTYTRVGFVSSDAMRLMDGGRERERMDR